MRLERADRPAAAVQPDERPGARRPSGSYSRHVCTVACRRPRPGRPPRARRRGRSRCRRRAGGLSSTPSSWYGRTPASPDASSHVEPGSRAALRAVRRSVCMRDSRYAPIGADSCRFAGADNAPRPVVALTGRTGRLGASRRPSWPAMHMRSGPGGPRTRPPSIGDHRPGHPFCFGIDEMRRSNAQCPPAVRCVREGTSVPRASRMRVPRDPRPRGGSP